MPLNIPNEFMQVAFHHLGANVTGEMINTLGIDYSQSTVGTAQGALDAASEAWSGYIQALHSSVISYTHATAMARSVGGVLQSYESLEGAIAGSGASPPYPMNVAMIVEKRTGIAGRKFRGRWFLGGMPAGIAAGGNPNEVDPGTVTTYQTSVDYFREALITAGLIPVLLHQVGGPIPTQITNFVVKPLVGTMRKRIR